jgi:acylphosphatase
MTAQVTGRVQGVGFRWWIRSRADALNLTGWVMNDADERVVAVVAEGDPDDLDEL